MSFTLYTPAELAAQLAARVRQTRLARGWTQANLADRTGIPLPTYRLFERTGKVSLERLIAVTSALGRAAEWELLLQPQARRSLDEIERTRPSRRRGRRTPVRPSADSGEGA